jgi:hypothetical protein
MSEKNSRTNSVDNTIFSETQSTRTDQNLLMIQEETFNNSTEENRPSVVEPPTSADTTFNSPRPTSMKENIILIPEKDDKEIPKIVFVELPNGLKGRLKRSNSRIETDINSVSFLNIPKLQKNPEPQEMIEKPTEELVEDIPPTLEELDSTKVAEVNENEEENQTENNKQDNSESKEKFEYNEPKTQTSQEEIPIGTEKKNVKIEIKDEPKTAPIKKEKTNDQIIYVNDRERTKKQWWFWPSNYIR